MICVIKITIDDEPASEHISKLKQKMSDYMTQGNDVSDPDIIEESPFERVYVLPPNRDDANVERALEGAEKIRNTVLNRGGIENDSAVEDACPWPNENTSRSWVYYRIAGPLAVTAEDIRWNTAYRLSDDAPHPGSDAFKSEASKLEIPKSFEWTSQLVSDYYTHLYDIKQKDDRPCHPQELFGESTVQAKDRTYERALSYLDKLAFVIEPERNVPAWEAVEQQQVEETATGEVNV